MTKISFIFLLFTIVIFNCFGQKHIYNENINKDGLAIIDSKPDLIKLSFAIEEFHLQDILVEELKMSKIIWGSAFLPGREGYPELPSITKNIVIPNDAQVKLSFISKSHEVLSNLIIHPAAKTPGELQKSFEAKRGAIYSEDSFYPKSPIQISYTEIRGLRVARVSIIPFQYNPVTQELIINKNMNIELSIDSKNYNYNEERFRSIYWDQILADVIFNFEDLPPVDYYTSKSNDEEGCDLLIICPNKTEFLQWADTIKRFRNEQGISTLIFNTEQIGGNNDTSIKQFIASAYESWNPVPSAILLLGDHKNNNDGVLSKVYLDHPEFLGGYVGDNYFGDITNNDLPDIVIGRIPANNDDELYTLIKKYINYETSPPINYSYYKTPLLACGYETNKWFQLCTESISGYMRQALGKSPKRIAEIVYWSSGSPETDPWSTAPNSELPINYFRNNGLNYIPEAPVDCGPWIGGTNYDIIEQLEAGSFLSIFRDHGGEEGYGCPEFRINDVELLKNKKFPTHLFSIACYNGSFNYAEDCIIEKLLFHQNGGVFSGTAASTWSWSFYNDCILWGTIDNLWQGFLPDNGNSNIPFREFRPAFGLAAGKYYMSNSNWITSDTIKRISNRIWHHFGDPFGIVYTSQPMINVAKHIFSLNENSTELEVEAEPFSLVCLSKDGEILARAFTDELGKTILNYTAQSLHSKLKIIITKQNFYRYEEDIYVVPEEGSLVFLKDIIIRDKNYNNQIDYNESVSVDLKIRNYGNSSSAPMHICISGNEDYYEILSDLNYELDSIPKNQQVRLTDLIRFKTDINVPDQHMFTLNIDIQNESNLPNLSIPIVVNAPNINISNLTFIENVGNGDSFVDPGETHEIELKITNIGHSSYPASTIEINSPSEHLNIIHENNQIPEIIAKDETILTYQIVVSPYADSLSIFQVDYWINNEMLPKHEQHFFFTGKVIEDFETGNLEKHPWYLSGDKDWEITSDYVESGEYAIKIVELNDNQEASLNLDYYFGADYYIYFSAQISTEFENDNLTFWVNDSLYETYSHIQLFGFSPKNRVLVPKGQNKLSWKYSKDESNSGGIDAVWIDNIYLPPIDSISNVGFQDIEKSKKISISPNPSNGLFNIHNNYNVSIEHIEIIAIDGRLIQSISKNILPKNQYNLNLRHLLNGSYMIKFTLANENTFIEKLIIQ